MTRTFFYSDTWPELMMYSQVTNDPKQKVAIEEFAMDYYNNVAMIQRKIRDIHSNVDTINGIIMTSWGTRSGRYIMIQKTG